jgi:hypothetical protein
MPETARCRSCGRPIRWATMPSGKLNPLDADPVPVPDGNVAAHFSTCANAEAHRRRGSDG